MQPLNVKVPEPLHEKIVDEAEERGLSKSEKVRNDLMKIYYD